MKADDSRKTRLFVGTKTLSSGSELGLIGCLLMKTSVNTVLIKAPADHTAKLLPFPAAFKDIVKSDWTGRATLPSLAAAAAVS